MKLKAEEEWRDIEGFNGRYAVSNYGRVRQVSIPKGREWGNRKAVQEKIINQRSSNGYHRVSLQDCNGKYRSYSVHRLVAMAFIPNPDDLPQVNHLNEDKSDNRVCNLEWSTASHNTNWGTRNARVAEKLKVPVIQVNINTGEKRYFDSTLDARRQGYKVRYKRNIRHLLIGGSGGDFLWFRADEDIVIPPMIDIRKSVIAISVLDGSKLEFESLSSAERNGFYSQSIKHSIVSGKPYKNYYWKRI